MTEEDAEILEFVDDSSEKLEDIVMDVDLHAFDA